MPATYVRLRGAEQLEEVLVELVRVVVDVAEDALTAWTRDVRDEAQRRVQVDSGELQAAIEARVDRGRLKGQVGVWKPERYYAPMLEHGTSSQPPQPYLGPAFELHRDLAPYVRDAWAGRMQQ